MINRLLRIKMKFKCFQCFIPLFFTKYNFAIRRDKIKWIFRFSLSYCKRIYIFTKIWTIHYIVHWIFIKIIQIIIFIIQTNFWRLIVQYFHNQSIGSLFELSVLPCTEISHGSVDKHAHLYRWLNWIKIGIPLFLPFLLIRSTLTARHRSLSFVIGRFEQSLQFILEKLISPARKPARKRTRKAIPVTVFNSSPSFAI